MKPSSYYFSGVLLLFIFMSHSESAAAGNCSFSKSVQQKGTAFDIISRPANGCAVQIVTVTARRSGKKLATTKADVDYLARSAQLMDLTGAGSPQLTLISRTSDATATEALDVYWLDGNALRRATVPELDDKNGYKGGDRFHLEGRLIIRTIPVYLDGDPAGKPGGGTRTIKYVFRDGTLTPSDRADTAQNPAVVEAPGSAPPPQTPAVVKKTPLASAAALAITWIKVTDEGIEIRTNRREVKYKTVLLNKPERIAINIPGADSFLAGKTVAINRFGISELRVGRSKGGLRLVMDLTNRTFDNIKVKSSGNSIFLNFLQ